MRCAPIENYASREVATRVAITDDRKLHHYEREPLGRHDRAGEVVDDQSYQCVGRS